MSSNPMQNNSEVSLETLLTVLEISRLLFTLFFQDNLVRQIFEEYAVDFIEVFEDFHEASIHNDVDRLLRILMQILELGEENNDEN